MQFWDQTLLARDPLLWKNTALPGFCVAYTRSLEQIQGFGALLYYFQNHINVTESQKYLFIPSFLNNKLMS